jgi:Ca2+/Na+ antiporter
MSKWQGFDQRKICPKCGEYQTRVRFIQPEALFSSSIRFSLVRYLAAASIPIIVLYLYYLHWLNVYLISFCALGFLGLAIFFAYRNSNREEAEGIHQSAHKKNSIGYSLFCHHCGYSWEITTQEWETAERQERENSENFPSRPASNPDDLNKSTERIEWKPPNPKRGVLIVAGFVGLLLMVSLFLYRVFQARAHPDNPAAMLINGIFAVAALFVYTGLVIIFKPKANKIALIAVILIALIGLVLAALSYFQAG